MPTVINMVSSEHSLVDRSGAVACGRRAFASVSVSISIREHSAGSHMPHWSPALHGLHKRTEVEPPEPELEIALKFNSLWVPDWSSTSCDLGVFVYQPVEQVATSQVKLGWQCRWW